MDDVFAQVKEHMFNPTQEPNRIVPRREVEAWAIFDANNNIITLPWSNKRTFCRRGTAVTCMKRGVKRLLEGRMFAAIRAVAPSMSRGQHYHWSRTNQWQVLNMIDEYIALKGYHVAPAEIR